MPKQLTLAETKEKWNFYVPKLLKAEYYKACLEHEFANQSAVLRALMLAFCENKIDSNILKPYIDEVTYITPNNKISKL